MQKVAPRGDAATPEVTPARHAAGSDVDRPRIKVLHLLPDLAIGGGQTIVLNHLRHADLRRFDVRVATLLPADDMREAFVDAGFPPIPLGFDSRAPHACLARLIRLLRHEQIDVLHVHSGIDRKVGQLAALATGVPVVGHLHSEWIHFGVRFPDGAGPVRRLRGQVMGRGRDWIERRTVRHYIAESESVATLFEPLLHAPAVVMKQAVPVDEIGAAVAAGAGRHIRDELGLAPDARVLLNISRMVEGKGQGVLVAMMGMLAQDKPDAVLVLVGDGDQRPVVEAEIARLGLTGRVHLMGNRFDIPALLAMGDVFVFASETEGFGLAVLEAMAASLPVAAFRLPALEEFATSGVSAHLVQLGDVVRLADAVRDLLEDPGRAAVMGRAGRAVVEARYPASGVAASFEPVYERVAGR